MSRTNGENAMVEAGRLDAEMLEELDALRRRLMDLEEMEVMRVTEEQERFDSLQVLDEYAKELEESRDRLAKLLRAGTDVQEAKTVQEALQKIAQAVGQAGWGSVSVTLFDQWDIVQSAYCGVSAADIEFLESHRRGPKERARLFGPECERFKVSRSYFVPADSLTAVCASDNVVPGRRNVKPGDTWDPMDLAYVPLYGSEGTVIGSINCDDPVDGRRPTSETFFLLELFADLAARKVETMQLLEQQRRTEAALRLSEMTYRTVFERSEDGFLILADGQFRDCNDKACDLWKCGRGDVIGRNPADFSPPFQPDGRTSTEAANEYIQKALAGAPQSFNWMHQRLDGSLMETEVTLAALEMATETAVLAIVRDITRRRQAELEREIILRILQIANLQDNMDAMIREMFAEINKVVPVENYFVALYDPTTDRLSFPCFKDEKDHAHPARPLGRGLSDWVLRHGRPLCVGTDEFFRMVEQGQVEIIGTPALSWLGVPLISRSETVGVLVVQSYHQQNLYTAVHERILLAIASQISSVFDRKRSEDALRRSEARLRATFDQAGVGIVEVDEQCRLVAANDRFCQILGYQHIELLGKSIHDLTAAEDRELSDDRNARLFAGEYDSFNYEKRYLKKDGTPLWVRVNATAIRGADGRLLRGIATVEDIHERKQAEDALRRSEARFRSVYEEATIGMLIVDADETIMDINPALQRILGYELAEIRERGLQGITHPADYEGSHALLDSLVAGRHDHYHTEKRYIRKDGGVLHASLTVFGIRDDQGRLLYTTGMIEDISLRKEAEERIRRHNEELEKLVAERTEQIRKLEQLRLESEKQVAVGRMAARIAHEINNPLAGIKNSFLLVKRAIPDDHPHYEFVGRIDREIERVARIVRQMFELYKPERKEASSLKPADVIREVTELLAGNSRSQGVSVELDTASAARPMLLHEDSLRQILFSVVQNAIEASPMGGLIRVTAFQQEQCLNIAVTDQGAGIPEDLRSKIFEPFFTTKSEFTGAGLGLGLSITRGLVESMNGSITFESRPGYGTTFHISLPARAAEKMTA